MHQFEVSSFPKQKRESNDPKCRTNSKTDTENEDNKIEPTWERTCIPRKRERTWQCVKRRDLSDFWVLGFWVSERGKRQSECRERKKKRERRRSQRWTHRPPPPSIFIVTSSAARLPELVLFPFLVSRLCLAVCRCVLPYSCFVLGLFGPAAFGPFWALYESQKNSARKGWVEKLFFFMVQWGA